MKAAEERGYIRAKVENISEDVKQLLKIVGKQNGRIKKLELWRTFILGGFAVFLIVVKVIG